MRAAEALGITIIFGAFVHQMCWAQICQKKKLNFENYGDGWSLKTDGDIDATLALRFSGANGLFFDPTEVTYIDVLFTEPTFLKRVKFKFLHTDLITVEAFQEGSTNPDATVTKVTGGDEWLPGDAAVFDLEKVTRISIKWTAQSGEAQIGIKHLTIVICDECEQWKLNYENYGGFWSLEADGVTDPTEVLRLSENLEFAFDPAQTTYFDVLFTNDTYVERVKVSFLYTESITVDAFKEGSAVPDASDTKITGGDDWSAFTGFVLNLDDVRKIRITWVAQAGKTELQMKKLVIVICGFKPQVSNKCLDCMCALQSTLDMSVTQPGCQIGPWFFGSCDPPHPAGAGCYMDRQHCRCGPYMITEQQFEDCKGLTDLPFDDFRTCAWNNDCVRQCLKAYMAEFALSCTGKMQAEEVTCKDFARMLYGGKNEGCKKKNKTQQFANMVANCAGE